ncbi:MAG: hypothetical protein IJA55_04845 [Clostridia bacterium]|nr:hypothetical protein [Clostridia bacterium]
MKKLFALVLCALLTVAAFASCGAPKSLNDKYLKGTWVAEFGLADAMGDSADMFEELYGVDLNDIDSEIKIELEFDGDGEVTMSVDEKSLEKYFEEMVEAIDNDEITDSIDELMEGMGDEFEETGEYELDDDKVTLINDGGDELEFEYEDGDLVVDESGIKLVFKKK